MPIDDFAEERPKDGNTLVRRALGTTVAFQRQLAERQSHLLVAHEQDESIIQLSIVF